VPRSDVKKVVLAYSGGLDTSVILAWLIEEFECEVVAFAANIGQGEEIPFIREKAVACGASQIFLDDLTEEFVRDFVFPALRANAMYEGHYLLGTSLARPLISKRQMEIAAMVGADAVSHGATGKGNDQVRFELGYYHFDPGITVIAPWREWSYKGRADLMEYCAARGIPVETTHAKPYSMDRNIFHTSYEGGILEDPWAAPPDEMFLLTCAPEAAPDEPLDVIVSFEEGDPVAVDGEPLGPAALLARLNEMAGAHGVGRVDVVENRYVGIKSRGVYETPGGTVLHLAHRALETITLDREAFHLKDALIPRYAEAVYNGYWFAAERIAMQALIDQTQERVTGDVRVRLHKGSARVSGRRSPESLYRSDFATFEADEVYDQRDAEGFIRLSSLRLRVASSRDR
jgi:argininosuccinate synthase